MTDTVSVSVDPGLGAIGASERFLQLMHDLRAVDGVEHLGGNRVRIPSEAFDALDSDEGLVVLDAPELHQPPAPGGEVAFQLPGNGGPASTPLTPGARSTVQDERPEPRRRRRAPKAPTAPVDSADALVAPAPEPAVPPTSGESVTNLPPGANPEEGS